MASAATSTDDHYNPLDRVERIAERHRWPLDRANEHELVMSVSGGWCDLHLSMCWRDDVETLEAACAFDLKVPEARQVEVMRLLSLVNAQLLHGHFDFWLKEGTIVFRHGLMLAGCSEVSEAQCNGLIRGGLDNCQRYYPAIQFVIWAGQTADRALENALLETHGEA